MRTKRISAEKLGFGPDSVHPNAVKVCRELQNAGYDGYLVGGCVRDLILGFEPKDFDVTTNATPEQANRLFPRSRIIGRRFRLLHVRFSYRQLIEVATYRGRPPAEKSDKLLSWFRSRSTPSGRILDDNVFGTIEQDAERRDFTINALYYDPIENVVLDFVGGLKDADQRKLKVIGDPAQRFAEDPVRMLRVIRFKAKLALTVDTSIEDLITSMSARLTEVPAARLFEEVLKLLHHAHAVASWELMEQYGFVDVLFPQLNNEDAEKASDTRQLIQFALENTDRRISIGKSVTPSFLFGVVLWPVFQDKLDGLLKRRIRFNEAVYKAGNAVFAEQCKTVFVPRRFSEPAIEIWNLQSRLERRRPRTIRNTMANRRFRAAYDLLLLRCRINQVDSETCDWWTEVQRLSGGAQNAMINDLRDSGAQGNRRRRQKSAHNNKTRKRSKV
ncbi:MAG: polynucleotide adenylyltransferase PcnB [Pseudomonadota bacterium]